jgi:hypothetical protein
MLSPSWFTRFAVALGLAAALDIGLAQALKRTWHVWYVLTPANNVRTPSPIFHHGLRPMMDVTHRESVWRYRLATNSLGMVDARPRTVDPKGEGCRVLFMGDSFTEGWAVGWEASFAGRLADRWAPQGIEVLNAGVSASAPSIYYRRVRHLIEEVGLRFDALFVAIDISDIRDEAVTFDLDGDDRVVQISMAFDTKFVRSPTPTDHVVFALVDNSFTARVAHPLLTRLGLLSYHRLGGTDGPPVDLRSHAPPLPLPLGHLPVEPPAFRPDSVTRSPNDFRSAYSYWSLVAEDWRAYGRDGLQIAAERMDRLVLLLRRHSIPLAVSVHPWPSNLEAREADPVQVRFWREWARTRGATFVDLFEPFQKLGPAAVASHYLDGDVHWNAAGHALVAEEIARRYDPAKLCPAR